MEPNIGAVSLDINKILRSLKKGLEKLEPLPDDCCIYKVPPHLYSLNKEAYTPKLVSFGPYHHGKKELKSMESHKLRYLCAFLKIIDTTMEEFIEGLKELEMHLRLSYVEIDGYNREKFIEIMAVDGAFLMQFLMVYGNITSSRNDRIFGKQQMLLNVRFDLLLIENQLPFFYLSYLFSLVKGRLELEIPEEITLIEIVQIFLSGEAKWSMINDHLVIEERGALHLLHLLIISLQQSERNEPISNRRNINTPTILDLHQAGAKFKPSSTGFLFKICLIWTYIVIKWKEITSTGCFSGIDSNNSGNLTTPTISDLHQAGAKFKRSSTGCFSSINFVNGVLEIPFLRLTDNGERIFRNMQAFEQCHSSDKTVANYISIMDKLINNEEDIRILVKSGIIENWLEDNHAAATVFNNLGKGNTVSSNFSYYPVVEKLNEYYKRRRHKWKATLKQKHFNNPWAIISVIAAAILLLLTVVQTVCSILQVV